MIDTKAIRARVETALREALPEPWLVGYDVNGIQELVTASGRPIAMRGASDAIARFDRRQGDDQRTIFAGGGRGILLVRSREVAEELSRRLADEFSHATFGGVLAATAVPYDPRTPRASLVWMRRRLDIEKDAARPPGGVLPTDKGSSCEDCRSYLATRDVRREASTVRLCERCDEMVTLGRGTGKMSISLIEFSEGGRIAAVSADGNNMGALFDSIGSLGELCAASHAIGKIFSEAHEVALGKLDEKRKIPLITGGDDLRAFLPPSGLLTYVRDLVREVERRAEQVGDLNGLLTRETADAFKNLGLGVGGVVADDHYPAWRLMAYAHDLEKSAKAACRRGQGAAVQGGVRSAFNFDVVLTGDAFTNDLAPQRRQPFSMATREWEKTLKMTEALAKVPPAQRAVLAEERTQSREEFLNLFRYQVARSDHWQGFYGACGLDWRDPGAIRDNLPPQGLLDLVRVLPRHERNEKF